MLADSPGAGLDVWAGLYLNRGTVNASLHRKLYQISWEPGRVTCREREMRREVEGEMESEMESEMEGGRERER